MLSICCNSHIKSWTNRKIFWKNKKIKRFVSKYNWEKVNFPPEKNDWKKFEKNNVTIACNVLYGKKEIYPAYVFFNSNREKQVILLMIPNGEGWFIFQ